MSATDIGLNIIKLGIAAHNIRVKCFESTAVIFCLLHKILDINPTPDKELRSK